MSKKVIRKKKKKWDQRISDQILTDDRVKELAKKVCDNYKHHHVHVEFNDYEIVNDGRTAILYCKLGKGTKVNRFLSSTNDIKIKLGLVLLYPYEENLQLKLAISECQTIEPKINDVLHALHRETYRSNLPIIIGSDMKGTLFPIDLAALPHLLMGGSSRSGKSVAMQNLIMSLAYRNSVDKMNLLLFDTGAKDLEIFQNLPHLSHPLINDAHVGVKVLEELVVEMKLRITYSSSMLQESPHIVCVIDEFISFKSSIQDKNMSKLFSSLLLSLLSSGRHAKIHIVLATQSTKIRNIGVDLGNITARMAFKCGNYHDSVAILGTSGAEKLSGNGNMLFISNDHSDPVHIKGVFMTPIIINTLILRTLRNNDNCDKTNMFEIKNISMSKTPGTILLNNIPANSELASIILWTLSRESISTLQIQKQFHMGNRASGIIDYLCEKNLITEKFSNQPRAVLPMSVDDISEEIFNFLSRNGISVDEINTAINSRQS